MSGEAAATPPGPERVRVWDRPTRLFHWLLVLLIPALWWTAVNDRIEIHMALGHFAFALLLFRLIWGVIGSSTARFSNFLKGPRRVVGYLSGGSAHAVGHNPLGGWSVAAMLAVLSLQVGLGLFATDGDGLFMGPLSPWVAGDTAEWMTGIHKWLFNLILALIALHVAAILWYALIGRRGLTRAMFTGRAAAPAGTAPMRAAPAGRFLAALAIATATALWLWNQV